MRNLYVTYREHGCHLSVDFNRKNLTVSDEKDD